MRDHAMTKARTQALSAISRLKTIDRRLTKLGCIRGYIHYKTGSKLMYIRGPRNKRTGKRAFKYIGKDPEDQKNASEKVARYKIRQRLRTQIAMLKQAIRAADSKLRATVVAYKRLSAMATKSVNTYRRYT